MRRNKIIRKHPVKPRKVLPPSRTRIINRQRLQHPFTHFRFLPIKEKNLLSMVRGDSFRTMAALNRLHGSGSHPHGLQQILFNFYKKTDTA